jgi:hypothetical protein
MGCTLRGMFRKLPRLSHGTAIAYVALFLALGGSGYAATQIVSSARAGAVKVRCSASRSGKKVSCKVVKGSGVGPHGPQGPQGPRGAQGNPGPSGPGGPLTLTEAPGFSPLPGGTVNVNNQSVGPNNEWQKNNIYTQGKFPAAAPGTIGFSTYLLSPSSLGSGTARLSSVDFCYGLQNTTGGPEADLSIIRATVLEFTEPDGTSSAGPIPAYTATPAKLIDQPLNDTGSTTGVTSCQTVSAPAAPVITRGGYLELELQVGLAAPNGPSGSFEQGWLYFGRVTTTYSP